MQPRMLGMLLRIMKFITLVNLTLTLLLVLYFFAYGKGRIENRVKESMGEMLDVRTKYKLVTGGLNQ